MSTLQEARQSAPQATTDAGVDDLKALAAKLKKKHRSGTAPQQQSNGDRGDAAAFLAGSARADLPSGNAGDASGEQLQKRRKKAKASGNGELPEQQGRRQTEHGDGAEAAPASATNGLQKNSGKKCKLFLKGAEDGGAPAVQNGKRQHADAELGQPTPDLRRTKKKKAKRMSVTDVN